MKGAKAQAELTWMEWRCKNESSLHMELSENLQEVEDNLADVLHRSEVVEEVVQSLISKQASLEEEEKKGKLCHSYIYRNSVTT